jgi:hypothetical protein
LLRRQDIRRREPNDPFLKKGSVHQVPPGLDRLKEGLGLVGSMKDEAPHQTQSPSSGQDVRIQTTPTLKHPAPSGFQPLDPSDQPLALEGPEHGQTGRTRHGMPSKGRQVGNQARRQQSLGQTPPQDESPQGESAPEGLAEDEDVRPELKPLTGPPGPTAAHTGLDLVQDQESPDVPTPTLEGLPESSAGRPDPALPLDGLDDNGGNPLVDGLEG